MSTRGKNNQELQELEKISPVKGILKRSSRSDVSISKDNDIQVQQKPEVMDRPINGNQVGKKTAKSKENKNKKVKLPAASQDQDSENETFDREYCPSSGHESVIGCERCKNGCAKSVPTCPQLFTN